MEKDTPKGHKAIERKLQCQEWATSHVWLAREPSHSPKDHLGHCYCILLVVYQD